MPQELRIDDFVLHLLFYADQHCTDRARAEVLAMGEKFIKIPQFRDFIVGFDPTGKPPEHILAALHVAFTTGFLIALAMKPYEASRTDRVQ